jgi:hypothetical protein
MRCGAYSMMTVGPWMVAKTEALGFEVLASSPETALQELRAYSTKWAQLVKERNIRIE